MNKDLVLREYLAIERTRLANETTLLAYIRTGLYFLVAGSTLGELINTEFWKIVGPPLIGVGLLIVLAGIARYAKVRKLIAQSRKNIGHSSAEFIRMVRGTGDETGGD
jgi:putative membrane protein